jgi:hypothetical protein
MDALLRDKRVFKTKVTRLEKQTVAWHDGTDKNTELRSIYLSSAQELTVECDSLFRSIGQQYEEKHYEVYEQEFDDINNRLLEIQTGLRGRPKQGTNTTNTESVTSQSQQTAAQVKLPKLQMPVFYGGLSNWLSFRD